MYLVKTPRIIDNLYAKRIWRMNEVEKVVYLTFDDGPIPEITPWILDRLNEYQAKATFFCVGENVLRHEDIYERILAEGHQVGNHTHKHLNASKYSDEQYFEDVEACAQVMDTSLFRPPYGRLGKQKEKHLLEKGYQIIMWDVLSGDFDPKVDGEKCFDNVIKHVQNGSIVVLHDNIKSIETIHFALPKILDHLTAQGYELKAIPNPQVNEN